jgi:hypothetical protein
MRLSAIKLACLASVLTVGFALPVMAGPTTETFTLDTRNNGATGNFGTVTLTDVSGGVEVTVTPVAGVGGTGFVNTGAGQPILFDLGVSPTTPITPIALVGSVTPGFSLASTSAGNFSKGSFGTFEYWFTCDTSTCGNGGNKPYQGALDFTISGLTINDFIPNSNGNYFAADLCFDVTSNDRCNGGANTGTAFAEIRKAPEPLTLSLFGAGLLGAAALRRRKKA